MSFAGCTKKYENALNNTQTASNYPDKHFLALEKKI